ncbi:FecR family protein [Dyella jiangningensis]|uniref:DUF6600 domain-containing protein n=2 Tax=Gammaproteobacteria TaxID=1236 RepID=UPI00088DF0DC|nr:DUF6600 domain-containing protein [Dyella sp. AtDHG13]PXV59679.1 FecR family protein [Dyella sp. AtDHG13]SDJ27426.1 FecR family protein [Dyella jiangningensis]
MRVLPAFLTSQRGWRWMAVALLSCASGLALAQTQAPPDDGNPGGDPPSRIARLSYRQGDVSLLPSGDQNWGDASLNRPLTTGDRLATGDSGRAELQLDSGTLRIADDSNFGFLTLNDQLTQVELTQGTVNLTVRNMEDGQGYEIDTPTVALVVNQPGTYRVDISEDGKSTRVTDFDGRATVYGEGGAQRMVAAGRAYEFADSSLNDVTVNDIEGGDDFDAWCNSRNQRYAAAPSQQYVSPDVVGAQDLDQYGTWQSDPDYGQVWYPSNVAADWSPYSNGYWSYVGPWGWTWVDAAPWGFAPYHYGRWAHVRERWCWVPGPIGVRPVYAPALVAFVGGAGFSVSLSSGRPVGWFPLGPGEVYNPWYRASRGYYTNVNVTNIYVRNNRTVVINNINNNYNYFRSGRDMPHERYMNRDVPHAFRAMSAQDFVAARNARQHMASVDPRQFANAPVMSRGVSGLAPVHTSFAPPRPSTARQLPTGGFQREVVARTPPAAGFAGRPANVAGAPRMAAAAAAPTNVRLLNSAPGPGMRTAAPNRQQPFAAQPNEPVRGNQPAQAQGPANRPAPRFDNEPAAMRPGELPSARFARPNGPQPPTQRGENNQARPGVSYIPNAAEDRQRVQLQGTLPNVPRIEQTQPPQAPRQPMNQDNAERMQRQDMQQRQAVQQQQEMQQRQAMQQQDMQQRRAVQQQQEMQQRQAMQQQQEMQQRQAMQRQQEMQQRQAMQQRQEMQQRQAMQRQETQQRGYEPPRGGYQPPQPQQQRQPPQGHEEHRAPPPPRKDEQHN